MFSVYEKLLHALAAFLLSYETCVSTVLSIYEWHHMLIFYLGRVCQSLTNYDNIVTVDVGFLKQ